MQTVHVEPCTAYQMQKNVFVVLFTCMNLDHAELSQWILQLEVLREPESTGFVVTTNILIFIWYTIK